MLSLRFEHRRPKIPIAKDLAAQIILRQDEGTIAVATDRPLIILRAVRREWVKLLRQAQHEASVPDRQPQCELNYAVRDTQGISFTAQDPAQDPVAYVSFATVEQFRLFPPTCKTLYLTRPVKTIDRHMLTSWMPRNGRVVIYDQT